MEKQVTVIADAGTSVQSVPVPAVKFVEFAATFRVQFLLVLPLLIFHETVAAALPDTADPGIFAANEMVLGVADRLLIEGAANATCGHEQNSPSRAVETAIHLRVRAIPSFLSTLRILCISEPPSKLETLPLRAACIAPEL